MSSVQYAQWLGFYSSCILETPPKDREPLSQTLSDSSLVAARAAVGRGVGW